MANSKIDQANGRTTMATYREVCERLGFRPETEFVRVHADGSVGFSSGSPDEVMLLLKRVRECHFRPHEGLLAAVRAQSARNVYLDP